MSSIVSFIFYISIYLISSFSLLLSKKIKIKSLKIIVFVIAIIIPCVMAALRDNVGTDFLNYTYMYRNNFSLSISNYFSSRSKSVFGIYLLARIVGVFNSLPLFFFLCSFLSYLPFVLYLYSKNNNYALFLGSFLYLTSFFTDGLNITKQIIAASFIVLSLRYVEKGKLLKWLCCLIVATMFHITALIFLPIYFIKNNRHFKSEISYTVTVALYICFAIFLPSIASLIGGRYESYFTDPAFGMNLTVILDSFWVILFVLFRKKFFLLSENNKILILMAFIGCILSLTGFYSPYVKRVALYFSIGSILLISQFPLLFKEKKIVSMLVIVYGIVLFYISYFYLGHADIIPYYFS